MRDVKNIADILKENRQTSDKALFERETGSYLPNKDVPAEPLRKKGNFGSAKAYFKLNSYELQREFDDYLKERGDLLFPPKGSQPSQSLRPTDMTELVEDDRTLDNSPPDPAKTAELIELAAKGHEHLHKLIDADKLRKSHKFRPWFVTRQRLITRFVPTKTDVADTFLLFACKSPEDAETAVGDLLEEYDVVRARRLAIVSNIWFIWQLSWLFVAKAKQRVIKSAFGSVLDKWIGPS